MSTTADREGLHTPQVALERSAAVQRLMSQFRPRLAERMPRAELRAELIVAVAFLLAAAPLAIFAPRHATPAAATVLLFVVLSAVTSRIEFDVGSGYVVPTQLVLVPMLYAMPPGWVPLLVLAGMALAKVPS